MPFKLADYAYPGGNRPTYFGSFFFVPTQTGFYSSSLYSAAWYYTEMKFHHAITQESITNRFFTYMCCPDELFRFFFFFSTSILRRDCIYSNCNYCTGIEWHASEWNASEYNEPPPPDGRPDYKWLADYSMTNRPSFSFFALTISRDSTWRD